MLWLLDRVIGLSDPDVRRRLVGTAAECAALAPGIMGQKHEGIRRGCIESCRKYAARSIDLAALRATDIGDTAELSLYPPVYPEVYSMRAAIAARSSAFCSGIVECAAYNASVAASGGPTFAGRDSYVYLFADTMRKSAEIVRVYYPEPPTLE